MNTALITGGAGFIGSNLADYLLNNGWEVVIFDNLSRIGSDKNLAYLKTRKNANTNLIFIKGDVRNFSQVKRASREVNVIFHLAGQVAVTTSVVNPRDDLETNILGTFNVLESARLGGKPIVIYASTNKVYGEMHGLKIKEGKIRYSFIGFKKGVDENFPLDFHSPYGCSKGAAEQYVRDYCRIYGVPTVVFRQSCIYGPRQMGVEDQGWVAHFAISGLLGRKSTIYGDGKQVRDLLYIDDLIDAYKKAVINIGKSRGKIYNIGGGAENSLSLLEYLDMLDKKFGIKLKIKYDKPRLGDQRIFISDNSKLKRELNWELKTNLNQGMKKLISWIKENKNIFK